MFYCRSCQKNFPLSKTGLNGKRKDPSLEEVPHTKKEVESKSLDDFLDCPTLELYYLLRIARNQHFHAKEDQSNKENYWRIKRLQLENIILERVGYYPSRIDQKFLSSEVEKIQAGMNFSTY